MECSINGIENIGPRYFSAFSSFRIVAPAASLLICRLSFMQTSEGDM